MTEKITRDDFVELMSAYCYQFDDEYKYHCKDGTIELREDRIICFNKVVFEEFRNYVMIRYPDTSEDMELMRNHYDNDFTYYLSYLSYKDFMNMDNPLHVPSFYTSILHYYFEEGDGTV